MMFWIVVSVCLMVGRFDPGSTYTINIVLMYQAPRLAFFIPGILHILCVSAYVFMCLVMSGAVKAMK